MDQERLDAILYTAAIIVALVAVRRVMRRSRRPDLVVKLRDNSAEIERRLEALDHLLQEGTEP